VKYQCYPKDSRGLGSNGCGLYRREGATIRGLHTTIPEYVTSELSTACVLPAPLGVVGASPSSFCTVRALSDVRSPASRRLPYSGGRSLGPVGTGCGTRHVGPRPRRAWPACRVLPLREACQIQPAPRDGQDARPGDGPVGFRFPYLGRGSSLGSTYERDLQARTRRTKPPCKLNPVLALLEADATYRSLR
jgi:hypothetical protein